MLLGWNDPVACHTLRPVLIWRSPGSCRPAKEMPASAHPQEHACALSRAAHVLGRASRLQHIHTYAQTHTHSCSTHYSKQLTPLARLVHVQVDDHALPQRAAGRFPHPPQRQRQVAASGSSRGSLIRSAVLHVFALTPLQKLF
jgi:hypothetical protein